jgi:hypothetical protein
MIYSVSINKTHYALFDVGDDRIAFCQSTPPTQSTTYSGSSESLLDNEGKSLLDSDRKEEAFITTSVLYKQLDGFSIPIHRNYTGTVRFMYKQYTPKVSLGGKDFPDRWDLLIDVQFDWQNGRLKAKPNVFDMTHK